MKRWYKNLKNAERDAAAENCEIVTGSNQYTDIYYLVPRTAEKGEIYRTIARAQGDTGREDMHRVIYKTFGGDLVVIDAASGYRVRRVKRGDVRPEKIIDYLCGYYTLAEEHSAAIRQRKENARISHMLCDESGKAGHEARQEIRRKLSNGIKIY